MSESCETCRYWRQFTAARGRGLCQRYPESKPKEASSWCGEWRARDEQQKARYIGPMEAALFGDQQLEREVYRAQLAGEPGVRANELAHGVRRLREQWESAKAVHPAPAVDPSLAEPYVWTVEQLEERRRHIEKDMGTYPVYYQAARVPALLRAIEIAGEVEDELKAEIERLKAERAECGAHPEPKRWRRFPEEKPVGPGPFWVCGRDGVAPWRAYIERFWNNDGATHWMPADVPEPPEES